MRKRLPLLILSLAASVILSGGLLAQEKIDVSIKVTKNGELVQDTTYQFDDASEAKHAIKIIEVLSGESEHLHGKHVVVVSSDDGDMSEDENVEVIVIKKQVDEEVDHDEDVDVEVKVVKKQKKVKK